MILVAVFNVVDGIDQGKGAAECLLFSAPFLVAAGVLIFAKSYKVNAWLYAAAGLAITATGSKGNFAGAIYIIFSFYIFNSAITNYALVGVTVFTIVCRYLFMGHSVPATINLLIAYAFTFGVYFVLMHPKPEPKPVVAHVDDVTIEVVKYVQDGKRIKDIASLVCLEPSTVYQRLRRAREKYHCDSNQALYKAFDKLGFFSQKIDRLP
jgi:hypothetical protein